MTHLLDPARWTQVVALFEAAADLPPEARARFLVDACGTDADLHAEVESLLAFDGPGAIELTKRIARILASASIQGGYT